MPKSTRVGSGKFYIKHPEGKQPIGMDRTKYETLKKQILSALKDQEFTHTELLDAVVKKLKGRFGGSVPWHFEWVKLDLEARKIIRRITTQRPEKYKIF